MAVKNVSGAWEAISENGSWVIRDSDGRKIATLEKGRNAAANAQLIAMSPYVTEAWKGLVSLVSDADLDDNGGLSGADTCDMARSAMELAVGGR